MFQVIADIDNSVLEEYDTLEGALSCSSMFSHTKVMYKGIEVMAPSSENREFIYWAEYQIPTLNEGKPFRHVFSENSFKLALYHLHALIEGHGRQSLLNYGIEERITITHKVKLQDGRPTRIFENIQPS